MDFCEMKDIINLRFKAVYEFLNSHYRILLKSSLPIIIIFSTLIEIIAQHSNLEFNIHSFYIFCLYFLYLGTLLTVMIYVIDTLYNNQDVLLADLKTFFRQNIFLITT